MTAKTALRLDIRNALARPKDSKDKQLGIAPQHGVSQAQLESIAPALETAIEEIKTQRRFSAKQLAEFRIRGEDLDLGFLDQPRLWLADSKTLAQLKHKANQLARMAEIFIVAGIGGSSLGARVLFQALTHPYHNELPRRQRKNRPRVYFEADSVDNDALTGLLDLLPKRKPANLSEAFTINVISKSGRTLETAAVFRILAQRARQVYGPDYTNYIVATTGSSSASALRKIAEAEEIASFEVPDMVGGRYSVFTAVGLLPAAVMGIDIEQLLAGAADMTRKCLSRTVNSNPAARYAAVHHLLYRKGKTIRVMSVWAKALEHLGYWYDQLLAESLGKDGRGPTPVTSVNTRDLHSRGQQHQQGTYDKAITNVFLRKPLREELVLPATKDHSDGLDKLVGKNLHHLLVAALNGTNQAYRFDDRPTIDIMLAGLTPYALGGLMQMLMIATVIEGKLLGVNPFGQPGVEAYKKLTKKNLGLS
ncbi:MAG: glucose-6-phosphate isomerase [Actinobacteria bacterium]|nr:glucose-6-phosphate isomerase [Actinomycetota bacterium]